MNIVINILGFIFGYLPLIIFLAIAIAVGVWVYRIKRAVKNFSRSTFGTDSIFQGFNSVQHESSETPHSINDMTRVYIPLILKDFPHLNLEEFKVKAQNALLATFQALESQDISVLYESSHEIVENVRRRIEDMQAGSINEFYYDVDIHQIGIANYQNNGGTCVITMQMSVGYLHYREKNGAVIEGSANMKQQCRYNVDMMYVQDVQKLDNGFNTAVATSCPNCGAQITDLGHKRCVFCGSMIQEINAKVWQINRIEKA